MLQQPQDAGNSTAQWRVWLFGGLRVEPLAAADSHDSERANHFRTHKTALLLVRLLLQPHQSLSRDELADWLWPDLPADRGRANLSQTLLHLRRQFGTSAFVADHRTVGLRGGVFTSDVALFERLFREARTPAARNLPASAQAARWEAVLAACSHGGDFLPGFYDDWIEGERTRLTEMREQAAQCLHHVRAQITVPPPDGESVSPNVGFPLTLTRFFGRETEREHLVRLLTALPPVRLVSLLGMGGIGKTRLAVEVAQGIVSDRDEEPFGFVAFVSLADLCDPAPIAGALRQTLGLDPAKDSPEESLETVCRFLRDTAQQTKRRVLLLLDNMEQLSGGSAPVVARLLSQVPDLTLLITSRQPIGVAGEQEMRLEPLPLASDRAELSPAVRLFVDRARLVRPDFALTPHNETAVGELCALLEGVPLALELAAAWVRSLSPAQIMGRLNHRFDVLSLRGVSGAGGDIPKRHRSLHAALAWSYDLLAPSLQTFFSQLSVFRGGWTMEAAQAVTGIRDASEPLLLLAERSLILAEPDEAGGSRCRMLESLREFAGEQWAGVSDAERAAVCGRHARYFEELSRQCDTLTRFGPERENVRAALAFALEPSADPSSDKIVTGVRLALQTGVLWSLSEGDDYLRRAADAVCLLPEEVAFPYRAEILYQQGTSALLRGAYPTARQKLDESLALWERLKDLPKAMMVRNRLASLASRLGDGALARAGWAECLQFAQAAGDLKREAAILNNLANIGSHFVGLDQRRRWIERAVSLDRLHSPGSHLLACSLNSLGGIALEQNDPETARTCLEEAHELAVADGSLGMVGVTKTSLAGFFLAVGEHLDRAESLLREAQISFEEKGEPPRLIEVTALRFEVALKRGDADTAVVHAREHLRRTREAASADDAGSASRVAAARAEGAERLRAAGFEAQAEALENLSTFSRSAH